MNSLSRWHRPNSWISDPFGYVFLPRAMLEIGKALFPDEWTGKEPTTPIFFPLPKVSVLASPNVKRDVHSLLRAERPDFARPPLDALPRRPDIVCLPHLHRAQGRPIVTFTEDEWAAARKIFQKREDVARPARRRYAKVCETVASACRSGDLVSALRPHNGGDAVEMRPSLWNTEGAALAHRFECFSLDPSEPFSGGLANREAWICVARNGLDALLALNWEAWICVTRNSLDALLASFRPSHTSTVKSESDATRHLAERLKQDPDLKKPDAEAECQKKFKISQRGFRDRVWPVAREDAGLPARARAGRKKKN